MTDRTPVKRGRGRPTMGLDHPKVQRVLEAAIRATANAFHILLATAAAK